MIECYNLFDTFKGGKREESIRKEAKFVLMLTLAPVNHISPI